MHFNFLVLAATSLVVVSCTPGTVVFRQDASGQLVRDTTYKPRGGSIYDDSFLRYVDECIAREESTGAPSLNHEKPKAFWHTYYEGLRSIPYPSPLPSEFKGGAEMVAYAKQKRHEHGLPTYD